MLRSSWLAVHPGPCIFPAGCRRSSVLVPLFLCCVFCAVGCPSHAVPRHLPCTGRLPALPALDPANVHALRSPGPPRPLPRAPCPHPRPRRRSSPPAPRPAPHPAPHPARLRAPFRLFPLAQSAVRMLPRASASSTLPRASASRPFHLDFLCRTLDAMYLHDGCCLPRLPPPRPPPRCLTCHLSG